MLIRYTYTCNTFRFSRTSFSLLVFVFFPPQVRPPGAERSPAERGRAVCLWRGVCGRVCGRVSARVSGHPARNWAAVVRRHCGEKSDNRGTWRTGRDRRTRRWRLWTDRFCFGYQHLWSFLFKISTVAINNTIHTECWSNKNQYSVTEQPISPWKCFHKHILVYKKVSYRAAMLKTITPLYRYTANSCLLL